LARTPRPVDPEAGPVQAFAHDLRVLREQAGNPTYRALAKTAGFSATTLGDAAGGVRLPSLEVALAYVGACGGDADPWRERWQELSRRLATERGSAEVEAGQTEAGQTEAGQTEAKQAEAGQAATGQPEAGETGRASAATETEASKAEASNGPGPETAEPVASRHWLRRPAPALAAAAALVLVVALLIWRLPSPGHSNAATVAAGPAASLSGAAASSAPLVGCPKPAPAPGTFTGVTYEQATNVRDGANTDAHVREELPAGCTLTFTGYCIGDVVASGYSASPDMRWFELSGGGLVASAVLHGSEPAGMAPSACPDDVSPPVSIELSAAPGDGGSGQITLQANGKLVWIVGFAAYYPGAPGETPQWHQLTMTDLGVPFFKAALTADIAAGAGPGGIPVVADACYGGLSPTSVFAAQSLDPAHPAALTPVSLSAGQLTAAEIKACSYPSTD
jgi:hypothetical protein